MSDRWNSSTCLPVEAEAEGELAALVRLQARRPDDVHAQDLLRRVLGDFFDFHAAGGRGDEGDAALLAVEQQARYISRSIFEPDSTYTDVDRQPFGAGLLRHEPRAEHGLRGLARLAGRVGRA